MAFFAMPDRVLYHDATAHGAHHFLTNFRFQCEAREQFLFTQLIDSSPSGRHLLQELLPLTQDGYTFNLAPVPVGRRVGILLSWEEPTHCSVRLCFRIVRDDEVPVCCGFQTLVCTSARTGEVVAAPEQLRSALAPVREKLFAPSFRERVLRGTSAVKEIFDEQTIRLGKVAAQDGSPRLLPEVLLPPKNGTGLVFTFPGQGSWEPKLLQGLCKIDREAATLLTEAEQIVRRLLGVDLRKELERNPDSDLAQVGNFLTSILAARFLVASGVTPDLLLGHSAGELAALVVAGALDFNAGAEMICRRVQALRSLRGPPGGMIALFCGDATARAIVEAAGSGTLEVSVVNHTRQTVVSGTLEDLDRLSDILASRQVTGLRLKSSYAFHSRLLQEAIDPFAASLNTLAFKPLRLPVYSPLERELYSRETDYVRVLPQHFVRRLHFPDALEDVHALGGRTFIECGGGVLTGFARQAFKDRPDTTFHAVLETDKLAELVRLFGKGSRGIALDSSRKIPEPQVEKVREEEPEGSVPMPAAIISLGCVLPGAGDADALWDNLLQGKSGIVDLRDVDPVMAEDFYSPGSPQPDKTYTLLCGRVPTPTEPKGSESPSALDSYFAASLTQCLAGLKTPLPSAERVLVVLGSTNDGSRDFDEQLLLAAALDAIQDVSIPAAREQFTRLLERALGRTQANGAAVAPYDSYLRVARRMIGAGVKVLALDAACASSLFAIDSGLKALRAGACDVAICGGAFAPGPANTCLFAQFGGLSATGSRPLDATADGVVFGEGAALLVLRRLHDALESGDNVLAVIRGTGTSSDGKSPSVMEPRKEGQLLALRRAADGCGVPPATLQYIDAHATGTPVGDAVEFASLCEAVGPLPHGKSPIRLSALKALLGHTGWVAGAASVIAMCKALKHQVFPPQPGFSVPNPVFELERSPFVIATTASHWPPNVGGLPRRAGVNAFGFGGCNAHLILEEYLPGYHGALCRRATAPPTTENPVIVGFRALFPSGFKSAGTERPWVFAPDELRLPANVRILPDAADDMDRGQIVAIRAVQELLVQLPAGWGALRADTGVVLGLSGKARRGVDAMTRVNLDRLLRLLKEERRLSTFDFLEFDELLDALASAFQRLAPSGPYTLPGVMPNVVAGRPANVFHLNGPTMVIDAQNESLHAALVEAERLLRFGQCKLVLAGAIGCCPGRDVERVFQSGSPDDRRPVSEAVLLIALAPAALAREHRWPVLGRLSCSVPPNEKERSDSWTAGTIAPVNLKGAEGAIELVEAIESIGRQGGNAVVSWSGRNGADALEISLEGAAKEPAKTVPDDLASLLAVPICWAAPRWEQKPLPPDSPARRLAGQRVLVLTDQPAWCLSPDVQAVLERLQYRLVCPASRPVPGAIAIDLASDATMAQSLAQLDRQPYEAILVLKDLGDSDPLETTAETGWLEGGLLELLFAASKHAYSRIEQGEVLVGVISLRSARTIEDLHPCTGLFGGYLRSLARELPRAVCRGVNTSDDDVAAAIALIEVEMAREASPFDAEVAVIDGRRYAPALAKLDQVAEGAPLLGRDSVALVTGGARGITAVLAEALLRRFGCSVILLGRTDPDSAPAEILALDDRAFDDFEPEFYRRELARNHGVQAATLRRQYENYRAAREVAATLRRLGTLGKVRYVRADVADAAAVETVVAQVKRDWGRVDLVLHGAGVQYSKLLTAKTLEEFRATLATKLGGMANQMRACTRHFPGRSIHFHAVTSTFSLMGNAGQEDYGAANLALDRFMPHLCRGSDHWEGSSLGWLGWFNVGMTRGSEYVNMAVKRRLRGVTRDEGAALFERYLAGHPVAGAMHLITDLESRYFGVPLRNGPLVMEAAREKPEAQTKETSTALHAKNDFASGKERLSDRRAALEQTWALDPDSHPMLRDHLIEGVPTVPGAFLLDLAARAARALRPEMHVGQFADTSFERFVKVFGDEPVVLRAAAEVIEETAATARIRVRLLSDFVHVSGRTLRKGVVHLATEVRLDAAMQPISGRGPVQAPQVGWKLPDPCLHPAGPFGMEGQFRSLHEITAGSAHSTATFQFRNGLPLPASADSLIPFLLLDSLWRFSAALREEEGTAPVCVPLRCERTFVPPGVRDLELAGRELLLTCTAPRLQDGKVYIDRAEAITTAGETLLALTNLVGLPIARVPAQAEPLAAVGAARRAAPKMLAGKIALVTGSSRGIGKAIASRLADEGAQVVVNSFHSRDKGEQTVAEIASRGGKALHVWGSVANPAHLERIFAAVGAECNGLDYFISNAGAGVFAPLTAVTAEHWDRAFRTNVVALHRGAFLAADLMRRRGGGKIVAVSSVGARLSFEHFGCIGPVKAAEESLVRYLATELSADNIQVNAVSAGPVLGELLDGLPSRPRWERLVPRGRLNGADEVVEAVLFLLTANGMNGAALPLDAGVGLRVCEPPPDFGPED